MKNKIIAALAIVGAAVGFSSCEKEFLQIPLSNATTVDSIFSTAQKAQGAWVNAYRRCIPQGLPYTNWWNALIQANISGELTYGYAWTPSNDILKNGLTATGPAEDYEGFGANWAPIRQAYLVIENIDRVPDLTATEKASIKGEMKALIAYRYEQMLIMYGGVPMVKRTFSPDEDLAVPRASVKETLDSIVSWCDQAIATVPSKWPDNLTGRITKSAAMAIKSKALLYAARPLFNSATPYLDFGSNNNLICLGNFDASRWQTAATAAEALITEAESAGGLQIINNVGTPLDNYGTATSVPGNAEVILAYKVSNTFTGANNWQELPINAFYNPRYYWQSQNNVLTTAMLENYYDSLGRNQTWPVAGTNVAFSDYKTRMAQMEPRFKASFMPYEMDAWNNPNDVNWVNSNVGLGPGFGCARSVKFYYKAGTRRWFEFAIFRLAAAYLSAAEAHNEAGNTTQALARLNKIRQRAGLPSITVTDQAQLRSIIQREWAIEFFDENYRLHDVKHWKLSNIANILGGTARGFIFNSNTGIKVTGNSNYSDGAAYPVFWANRMYLNPFPQSEINKGILVQNPGY